MGLGRRFRRLAEQRRITLHGHGHGHRHRSPELHDDTVHLARDNASTTAHPESRTTSGHRRVVGSHADDRQLGTFPRTTMSWRKPCSSLWSCVEVHVGDQSAAGYALARRSMTLGRCSCGAGSPRWMLRNSAMNSRHSSGPPGRDNSRRSPLREARSRSGLAHEG